MPAADGATKYSSFTGYAHLSAGMCCGLRYVIMVRVRVRGRVRVWDRVRVKVEVRVKVKVRVKV